MLTRKEFLVPLARRRTDEVVVTTMSVVRAWGRHSDHDLDFASADSAMGHAADLALGIALACPERKVLCLNGDGSMLMNLGTLVTIVEAEVDNLIIFVVANRAYEITGNQPIPGAGSIDFVAMAKGAGFERVFAFDRADEFEGQLERILSETGPTFVCVCVEPGSEGVISRGPEEEARYLQVSLADWSQQMRSVLAESDK
jgi:thiamine pyrophosphate-dependent acetolactate synthase large subunit-like protein